MNQNSTSSIFETLEEFLKLLFFPKDNLIPAPVILKSKRL